MSKINEYDILMDIDFTKLVERVNAKLHDGWKIVGGVVIDTPRQTCITYYIQTMER